MNSQNEKCVLIIDENLPLGIIANTAAVLGITLGYKMPEIIGPDVADQNQNNHLGITSFPIPILKGTRELIKETRQKLYKSDFNDLTVVDFSDLAQSCIDYDDFTTKLLKTPEAELQYLGIAICGAKKKINKLTGSLPLLR